MQHKPFQLGLKCCQFATWATADRLAIGYNVLWALALLVQKVVVASMDVCNGIADRGRSRALSIPAALLLA